MSERKTATAFLLADIRAPFDVPEAEVIEIAKAKMKRLCSSATGLHFRLYKKSFDARKKPDILQVCSVLATADEPIFFEEKRFLAGGVRPFAATVPEIRCGEGRLRHWMLNTSRSYVNSTKSIHYTSGVSGFCNPFRKSRWCCPA